MDEYLQPMKRIFALLLAFALALCLAMPAFALEEEEEPDPAMPVITVQPESQEVKYVKKATLRIEAEIPNGDTINYIWYRVDEEAPITFGPEFKFRCYDKNGTQYYCVVQNMNELPNRVVSEVVTVKQSQKLFSFIMSIMLPILDPILKIGLNIGLFIIFAPFFIMPLPLAFFARIIFYIVEAIFNDTK